MSTSSPSHKRLHPIRAAWAWVVRFVRDTRAVSTVEYALIVVAVIGIVVAGAVVLEEAFTNLFNQLGEEITEGIDEMTNDDEPADPAPAPPP